MKIGSLVSCVCESVCASDHGDTPVSLSTLVSWIIPNRSIWTDFPDNDKDNLPWYNHRSYGR